MRKFQVLSKTFFYLSFLFLIPIFFILKMTEKDIKEYRIIEEEDSNLHAKGAIEEVPIHSVRKKIMKDLWISQNNHFHIEGEKSHLNLVQKGSKIEACEWTNQIDALQKKGDESQSTIEANCYYLDSDSHFSGDGEIKLNFQIDGKNTMALCDTVFFDSDRKKIVLESLSEKKVLFLQEGVEMSAQRIEIGDRIEAIGNVHFFFNEQEQKRIQCNFFK